MAQCKDCGAPYGCGCQLVNGRCSACNYAYQQSLVVPQLPQPIPSQSSPIPNVTSTSQ